MDKPTKQVAIGYKRFVTAWFNILSLPIKDRSGNIIPFPEPFPHPPDEQEWEEMVSQLPQPDSPYRHPPLRELLLTFPEAVDLAKEKISELHEDRPKIEQQCNEQLDELFFKIQSRDPGIMELVQEIAFGPLEILDARIKQWEKVVKMDQYSRKPKDGSITDDDITEAKHYPLTNFVSPNQSGFIPCPFHNEKTASCKVFKDNRFHCFGCQADGDVIDFVMRDQNVDFINAVKFILGK